MSTDPSRELTPAYQQPMPYAPPPLIRPTSGMAVAGFVLSLLGFSIISVFLSGAAMKRTKTGEVGGHGLAVAGLIISIVGLVGGVILFLVLFLPWLAIIGAGAAGSGS